MKTFILDFKAEMIIGKKIKKKRKNKKLTHRFNQLIYR